MELQYRVSPWRRLVNGRKPPIHFPRAGHISPVIYNEYEHIFRQKCNTAAAVKEKDLVWEKTADYIIKCSNVGGNCCNVQPFNQKLLMTWWRTAEQRSRGSPCSRGSAPNRSQQSTWDSKSRAPPNHTMKNVHFFNFTEVNVTTFKIHFTELLLKGNKESKLFSVNYIDSLTWWLEDWLQARLWPWTGLIDDRMMDRRMGWRDRWN